HGREGSVCRDVGGMHPATEADTQPVIARAVHSAYPNSEQWRSRFRPEYHAQRELHRARVLSGAGHPDRKGQLELCAKRSMVPDARSEEAPLLAYRSRGL